MKEIKNTTVREFKARLSYYMDLMRKGEVFRVNGYNYGMVTTPVTTPNAEDCFAQDAENNMKNKSIDNLSNEEKKEAEEPIITKCSNCKNDWDIEKVPCYEVYNEELGEDVIMCNECIKFKSGGSRKVYKSLIRNMKAL